MILSEQEGLARLIKSCFRAIPDLERIQWDGDEILFYFSGSAHGMNSRAFDIYTVTKILMTALTELFVKTETPPYTCDRYQ